MFVSFAAARELFVGKQPLIPSATRNVSFSRVASHRASFGHLLGLLLCLHTDTFCWPFATEQSSLDWPYMLAGWKSEN
ncbi:hypothetical protein NC652_008488 [Populus alba x Populus x berolinensis]|nr:hypothetical protein NC652_008488 [Populus alba x Populus x berolinensis]